MDHAALPRSGTLARSLHLFRAFLVEQTDPDRFYSVLAADSTREVARFTQLSGADVVDVGGGPGYFADAFAAAGARYLGIEPDAGELTARGHAAANTLRASGLALPLAEASVDLCYSSHVLEHVPDPAAVVAEITRVGRAGYIEVPEAASAKILDFPSHLWWVRRDGEALVFEAKSARAFDPEIADYVARSGVEGRLAKLLDSEFDHRVIALPWTGTVDVRVEGSLEPGFVAAALAADAHHNVGQSLASRALTSLCTLPLRHGPRRIARRQPIELDAIVAPHHRRGTGETLRTEIYRL